MRAFRTTVALAAMLLIACRGAQAQLRASPVSGAEASEPVGCALPPDTARLQVTLPIEVLNALERMSSSTFVHAFLIRYIADAHAGDHRLAKCARAFVAADVSDLGKLRQNLPDAAAIIDALRTAELARLRTVLLTDSAQTLATAVARLRADASPANLELSSEQFTAAKKFCETNNIGACSTLGQVMARLADLRRARDALAAAGESARQSADQASRATQDAQAATAALAADTARLAQLQAAGSAADTAAIRELQTRKARWTLVADSLAAVRNTLLATAARAEEAQARATTDANGAQARLGSMLSSLQDELQRARTLANHSVAVLQGSRIGAVLSAVSAPPPAQAASANPSVGSANLLLALTDFIIGRMRREAVNSFIVNLHDLARSEPLLRDGFPETWSLMQGLSTRSDGRLNAVDVGRIPLTTWRATLAGDFVKLPVSLLEANPVAVCRGGEASRQAVARQRALAGRDACRQRLAVLRPLVPVATRMLEGDAVFDILRDAPSFAPPQGADLPPEWRHVAEGLTVVSALAQTFLAQGYAPAADPTLHPYLLTAQSVVQVPQQQRDAFIRLLLVQAVPPSSDVPARIDAAALQNATVAATRLLERIASRPAVGEPRPADAALLVHGVFDALVSAAEFARVLAPPGASAQLDSVRMRWRAVSGAIEPIVSRDFGLALSRTTVLLRDLRGVEVPGPMLTLAALASSLSEAQNGAQIRDAFETAASPVGGWQAKRYGEGGGSITAFPGLAFGIERVIREGGDPAAADQPAKTLGAALPIGLEWQFRLKGAGGTTAPGCVLAVCGVGVFIPLIDLGALLSYRLDGPDSVEKEPNATVRQVFAPGAYLSLALTRTVPVNLLLGAQLMPSLRSVDGPEGTASRSAYRFGAGISMDILLLKF